MQSLITLLIQLSAKTWAALVVAVLCGGAATVFYFSSANAGSHSTPARPPAVVQAGHIGNHDHSGGLEHCAGSIPVVPEANAGLVLIPVVAAMLAVSARRLRAAKASLGTEGSKAPGQASA
jgi:hypothetical protein